MSYSQNNEEAYILDFFSYKQLPGKFIDIGAYDVFRFSNVRALYERGWAGVLVEPAPQNYKGIADYYKDEPKIKVLNVAIGEINGEIDFYESDGDAVSTTDEDHMKKWGDAGVKYTKIKVPQVGVVDFFNEYCKDIDFLSIDTEATNIIVFRNTPNFVWEQIQLLCIEHDNNIQEIEEKLSNFGFITYYTNGENILLGK
jgi:FkbM family methyltransferase